MEKKQRREERRKREGREEREKEEKKERRSRGRGREKGREKEGYGERKRGGGGERILKLHKQRYTDTNLSAEAFAGAKIFDRCTTYICPSAPLCTILYHY